MYQDNIHRTLTEVILWLVCKLSKLMLWRTFSDKCLTLQYTELVVAVWPSGGWWWWWDVREARLCRDPTVPVGGPQSVWGELSLSLSRQLRWRQCSVIPTVWASLVSVITVGVSTTATQLTTRTNTPPTSTTPHCRSESTMVPCYRVPVCSSWLWQSNTLHSLSWQSQS